MAGDLPKHITEAVAAGFTIQTDEENGERHPDWFNERLMTKLIQNCTLATEGDACSETACIGGIMRRYYCTGGQCRKRYTEHNCQ